jgi:hypothetical protein
MRPTSYVRGVLSHMQAAVAEAAAHGMAMMLVVMHGGWARSGPGRATTSGRGGSAGSCVSGVLCGNDYSGGWPARLASSPELLLAAGEAGCGQHSSSATVRPVWLLAFLVVVEAGICISLHFAGSEGIEGMVKDQGESPARCLSVRTTTTPEGAASFLKAWSLLTIVPFLSSEVRGNPMSSP